MKRKLISLACMAVIGVGIVGGTASADGFEPTSGSYTYEVNDLAYASRALARAGGEVTEYVGGGTWKHNSWIDGSLIKHCTSKYYHSSNRHSSTAKVGSNSDRDVKGPGIYTNASAKDKYGFSATANWNNKA